MYTFNLIFKDYRHGVETLKPAIDLIIQSFCSVQITLICDLANHDTCNMVCSITRVANIRTFYLFIVRLARCILLMLTY